MPITSTTGSWLCTCTGSLDVCSLQTCDSGLQKHTEPQKCPVLRSPEAAAMQDLQSPQWDHVMLKQAGAHLCQQDDQIFQGRCTCPLSPLQHDDQGPISGPHSCSCLQTEPKKSATAEIAFLWSCHAAT